jgi:hypothetical protein
VTRRRVSLLRLRLRRRLPGRATALLAVAVASSAVALATSVPASAAFTGGAKLPGLGNGHIWSVAVQPGDPNQLLAGTDQGVYRSADAGATWTQTSLQGTRVWAVGFDARDPHASFAGLDTKGVSRSDDGGKTWADVSDGLTNLDVRSLAFGLEGVAAGTRSGVSVSGDGKHWRTAGLDGFSVSSLAVAANQPQLVLIAGVDGNPPGQGGYVFRNNGGGVTWETLQSGLPSAAVVSSVSAGPLPTTGSPRPLLVTTNKGTYHSGDGGGAWTSSTGLPEGTNLTSSSYSPNDPNLVYAGADAGGSSGGVLMRSTDGGASFTVVADALPEGQRNVASLAVGQATPPVVIAAVNPPAAAATVFHGGDAGAPAPGGAAADAAGAALASSVPTPKTTPHPKTAPKAPAPPAQSTGLAHIAEVVVRFPFPLLLEIVAIAVIVYLVLRWRQRYLDVEGPP